MASEPYWAEAPSRSTSTRLKAMDGSMPMLGPCAPLPADGTNSAIIAARCRRLPFTITSVWSGARPRSEVGRTKVSPSPDAMLALNEGTFTRRLSVMSAELPTCPNASSEMTSMGAVDSSAERPRLRDPITTISSITASAAASCALSAAGARPPDASKAVAARAAANVECESPVVRLKDSMSPPCMTNMRITRDGCGNKTFRRHYSTCCGA